MKFLNQKNKSELHKLVYPYTTEKCYIIRHIMVITSMDIVQHAMKMKGLMFIVLWAFQQAV